MPLVPVSFWIMYINCRCSFSETPAICLPRWTDGATPQTVQCWPACPQCRSPVSLKILWQITICVNWPLNLTVSSVSQTLLFTHYWAQRIDRMRYIMSTLFYLFTIIIIIIIIIKSIRTDFSRSIVSVMGDAERTDHWSSNWSL